MENRDALRTAYRQIYDDAVKLFFEHDPVGINYEVNTDEYEPEVGTVLPRLHHARSLEDVHQILIEEFRCWFGYGTRVFDDRLKSLAFDLWKLWLTSGLA